MGQIKKSEAKLRRAVELNRTETILTHDDGIAKLYGVTGYPGNFFIDRQGKVRYFQDGAFDDGGRRLEIILRELLK